MGIGKESLLYDPESELYYWEGENSASITINGMGKRKNVRCITAVRLQGRAPGASPSSSSRGPRGTLPEAEKKKRQFRGAAPGSSPPQPRCVPKAAFHKNGSAHALKKRPAARDTRSRDPHTIAPAHESMRSAEHGSGHQEQLAFSSSAALLLSIVHPSRERTNTLELRVGSKLRREACRAQTQLGLPT